MDNVRRGETCSCRCNSSSACRSRPSVMDRFNVSLFAHATVGMLSQNIPILQCLKFGMTASKAIHTRISTVSSKYEFVMYPYLLFSDTKWLHIFAGNRIYHTMGGNGMFHSSKHTLRRVLTRPWILCITECPEWVCIRSLVTGIFCSVAWANLLVWVPSQRPVWCWWCWDFFVGPCWAVEIVIFWIGLKYHYVASVPLVFENSSGIGTWRLRLLCLPFLDFAPCMWLWRGRIFAIEVTSQALPICGSYSFAFDKICYCYWIPSLVAWPVGSHKNFMDWDENIPRNVPRRDLDWFCAMLMKYLT